MREGLERARAAGMKEVAVFMSASETHNKKNVNKSIEESLRTSEEVTAAAKAANMRVRGYVSTVWGCPYEGAIDPKRALAVAERLYRDGNLPSVPRRYDRLWNAAPDGAHRGHDARLAPKGGACAPHA